MNASKGPAVNHRTETEPRLVASSGVTPVEVRSELAKILASDGFARSDRHRRFLSFVVERTLTGESASLDEYALATEVFNRSTTVFAPDSDPIVRVEAGRLRKKLDAYYQTHIPNGPVVIELPPKTYVPVFRPACAPSTHSLPEEQPAPEPAAEKRVRSLRPLAAAGAGLAGLVVLSAGWLALSTASPEGDSRTVEAHSVLSLAVLPFRDISPAQDQGRFCDALTLDVIEQFAKLKNLRVVSGSSSMAFKGVREDVRRVAGQLNVQLVIEGSVLRLGNRLVVSVELINARDGFHVWTKTYDRQVEEVFAFRHELALSMASTLADIRWLRSATGLKAYEAYLKGLHFETKGDINAPRNAIAYYEEAIEADPGYAPSYAGVARGYARLGIQGDIPPALAKGSALTAIQQALALNPNLPEAHAALGTIRALYEWNWEGAWEKLRRAHELDPDHASVHEPLVMAYLIPSGQLDEALTEAREAQELDPVSARFAMLTGLVHYFRREHRDAATQFRTCLRYDPHYRLARLALARAGTARTMTQLFTGAALKTGSAAARSPMEEAALGFLHGAAGSRAEAEVQLDRLLQWRRTSYVSPFHVATVYMGLGDTARALEWLEKARAERSPMLAYLNVDPVFDTLRSDPGFMAIVREVHPRSAERGSDYGR